MSNDTTTPARPDYANDRTVEATITAIDFAEPISNDAPAGMAFDLVFTLTETSGESHTWRSEVSNAYGRPNTPNATKTRAATTLEALARIGWTNPDLSTIESMVNKVIPISIKYNYVANKDKWYKNVWLGGGGIKTMERSKALNIMRMLGGGAPTASAAPSPFVQPMPTASVPPSPFR